MGVISLHFLDYIVEVCMYILFSLSHPLIGCALSAPDGSSPRGYVCILVDKHRLKISVIRPPV
jgi:hypothetical protein